MATREALLDPTGLDARAADPVLAARPASLRGRRFGLLDNTKANAIGLLTQIATEMTSRYGTEPTDIYAKDYFGTPAKELLVKQLVADCDVVVTAIGDCGSCSAATVADGIMLERAGVPAVAVVSDAFLASARAMARVQGFPGYEFVAVRHPVASLDAAQLRQRALEVVPQVARILGAED